MLWRRPPWEASGCKLNEKAQVKRQTRKRWALGGVFEREVGERGGGGKLIGGPSFEEPEPFLSSISVFHKKHSERVAVWLAGVCDTVG
jgi:hypothetical protein